MIRSFFVPASKVIKAKRNGSTTCSKELGVAAVAEGVEPDGVDPSSS